MNKFENFGQPLETENKEGQKGEKEPKIISANEPDEARREADIDLIKKGADYKLRDVNVGPELAEELKKEQEGEFCKDVATWIRLHKEIVMPIEAIGQYPNEKSIGQYPIIKNLNEKSNEDLRIMFKNNIGAVWQDRSSREHSLGEGKYFYIDSNGNIASFEISPEKIKSLEQFKDKTAMDDQLTSAIENELTQNGFKLISRETPVGQQMRNEIIGYRRKIMDAQKNEKKEFDF